MRRIKSRRLWIAAVALAIAAAVTSCDDGPSKELGGLHWTAYATETTSRRTVWLFLDSFRSADDCYHAAHRHLVTKQDSGFYDFPMGCSYSGSNRYWVWLVNRVYQASGYSQSTAFECAVSRSTNATDQAAGLTYGPVLRGSPREGSSYYCVM